MKTTAVTGPVNSASGHVSKTGTWFPGGVYGLALIVLVLAVVMLAVALTVALRSKRQSPDPSSVIR